MFDAMANPRKVLMISEKYYKINTAQRMPMLSKLQRYHKRKLSALSHVHKRREDGHGADVAGGRRRGTNGGETENGAAGWDRTSDPWLRRPILYPLSYSRVGGSEAKDTAFPGRRPWKPAGTRGNCVSINDIWVYNRPRTALH
jgi:hypothetical protein